MSVGSGENLSSDEETCPAVVYYHVANMLPDIGLEPLPVLLAEMHEPD
jgi:hypothetical protein